MNHSEIVSFLWGVADLVRDTFKRGKYQDVILPLTVLRRLDCVLAPTKERVLKRQGELKSKKLEDLDPQLRKASGFAFYNTSRYDFEKLLGDAPHLAANLRNYIAGFSPNMREVLEKFDSDNTISKLEESGLLFQVLERFKNVDRHPEEIDNPSAFSSPRGHEMHEGRPNGTWVDLSHYPACKDSGVEWLGKIPVGWESKRLKFSAQLNPKRLKKRAGCLLKPRSPSYQWRQFGQYGGLDLTRTKLLAEVGGGYTLFRDGDVVVAKITPCFENGKGAHAAGLVSGIAFGTTELHVMRATAALDDNLLFYSTLSDPFRKTWLYFHLP